MNKNIVFQQMKKQVCKAFVAATALLAVVACTNEETVLEMPEEPAQSGQLPAGWVSARGRMDLSVKTFDGEAAQTRAEETDTWAEGDKIYFMIEVGQTKTPVVAVYSKVFSAWSFNYNASATIPASGTMKGCYLEGATSSDYSGATLGADGIVYIDSKASYTYQNGEFAITVNLKPSYVRMRFAGTQGQAVVFSGLSRVTSFDATTYTFEQTPVVEWLDASSTAENEKYYTPYVYGYLNADNKIYIETDGYSYGRTITTGTLSAGESAWMTMPSGNYIPKGWSAQVSPYTLSGKIQWSAGATEEQKSVILSLVKNMVHVSGAQFVQNSYGDPVDIEDFYVNKFEVTQKEWTTIMGSSLSWTSSYGLGDNVAAYYTCWRDCDNFISALNNLSGLTFRFPTGVEWEFAAHGGNKSKGYTYSGSNTVDEVAWYSGNSSYIHEVGKKQANELGLYDMSGNVSEWISNYYSSYYYYYKGGNYGTSYTYCQITNVNSYDYYTDYSRGYGMRLFHGK